MTTITRTCTACGRELPAAAFDGPRCRVCKALARAAAPDPHGTTRRHMAASYRRLRVRELLAQRAA